MLSRETIMKAVRLQIRRVGEEESKLSAEIEILLFAEKESLAF